GESWETHTISTLVQKGQSFVTIGRENVPSRSKDKTNRASPMKKVLLIIIDALASRVVVPALEQGKLPNFQRLVEAGVFVPECYSIFPSITPAATCSLCTGAYPFEHGISGAYWYDPAKDEVAYFGDDILAILNEGVSNYL